MRGWAIVVGLGVMIVTLSFLRRRKTKFDALYASAEVAHGLPRNLLYAIAEAESAHNPSARSSAGALGLMQLMPATAGELGVNPLNPAEAVDGAGRYMRTLHNRFGTWALALMAYNWGQGNVSGWLKEQKTPGAKVRPVPRETQDYLGRILGRF